MYFITMIDKIDLNSDRQPQGWFESEESARELLEVSFPQIHITAEYEFAVIEKVPEGYRTCSEQIQWYMHNPFTGRYNEIESPDIFKDVMGFCFK